MIEFDRGSNLRPNSELIWVGRSDIDPYWSRCGNKFSAREFDSIYEAVAEVLTGSKARLMVLNAAVIGGMLKTVVPILLAREISDKIFIYNLSKWLMSSNDFSQFIGNPRVRIVDDENQLISILKENFQSIPFASSGEMKTIIEKEKQSADLSEEPEIAVVATKESMEKSAKVMKKSSESAWPIEPPTEEIPFVEILPVEDEATPQSPSVVENESENQVNVPLLTEESKDGEPQTSGASSGDLNPDDLKLAQLTQAELDALLGGEIQSEGDEK